MGGVGPCSLPDTFAVSLTHLKPSRAWHPQGPIHPTPPPRATTFHTAPRPARVARRAVVWGGGDGPLWVPGLPTRRSLPLHAYAKCVIDRRGVEDACPLWRALVI